MTRRLVGPGARWLPVLGLIALTGCATADIDQTLARTNQQASTFTQGRLALARTAQAQAERAVQARTLLAGPLDQGQAVALALVNSPDLQALLARRWADATDAAQGGRLANPVFRFERMVAGAELEIARAVSVGLWELLTWPWRHELASARVQAAELRLTSDVVARVTRVREAWVRAVAARQARAYAAQVHVSAQAGAELARRMQAAGNLNRLDRSREHLLSAQAAARLAVAAHEESAAREALVRELGLDAAQAEALRLPERLPDLPAQVLAAADIAAVAADARLDVRLARHALGTASGARALARADSLIDIEAQAERSTRFPADEGSRESARTWEFALRLPVFDAGGLRRAGADARTLAAGNALEATLRSAGSSLREAYSAYRTAHAVALHHRDEVVPLQRRIAEENLLRYNAMLIGTFELLADARDQVAAVTQALQAQTQFWLADAALQAELVGMPTRVTLNAPASESAAPAAH